MIIGVTLENIQKHFAKRVQAETNEMTQILKLSFDQTTLDLVIIDTFNKSFNVFCD